MKVKKQHLQLAVAVVVVAVVWSVSSLLRRSSPPPTQTAPRGEQQPILARDRPRQARSTATTVDPASIPAPPSVDVAAGSSSVRDPFLFGSEGREVREAPIPVGANPLVRSILFSSGRRLALIENRIVRVGDVVGDFRVVQIERDAVTFATPAGERRRVSIRGQVPAGAAR